MHINLTAKHSTFVKDLCPTRPCQQACLLAGAISISLLIAGSSSKGKASSVLFVLGVIVGYLANNTYRVLTILNKPRSPYLILEFSVNSDGTFSKEFPSEFTLKKQTLFFNWGIDLLLKNKESRSSKEYLNDLDQFLTDLPLKTTTHISKLIKRLFYFKKTNQS